ncbi:unnamed protein product, partial [Amoebophrya sp. A25]
RSLRSTLSGAARAVSFANKLGGVGKSRSRPSTTAGSQNLVPPESLTQPRPGSASQGLIPENRPLTPEELAYMEAIGSWTPEAADRDAHRKLGFYKEETAPKFP